MSQAATDTDSPYRRDNYFGKTDSDERSEGHRECTGTDPADYLAYQHLSHFTELVCGRTLREHDREQELSEPCLYLPKEVQQPLSGDPVEECPSCGSANLRRVAPLTQDCRDCDESIEEDRQIRFIEYRQHRHRRRINPETGWINWGETTSTAVPDADAETYMLAVKSYLRENGVSVTALDQWLEYANRLFHDPQRSANESLALFISKKREYDSARQDPHRTATIPD